MPDRLADTLAGWKRAQRLHVLMPSIDAVFTNALGAHRALVHEALKCGWRPMRHGEVHVWAERKVQERKVG